MGHRADPAARNLNSMSSPEDPPPAALPIDGTLDLHAFAPREVAGVLDAYIDACREKAIHQLRVVHGKGTGTLRRTVEAALKKDSRVRDFGPGGFASGGWGATLVELYPIGQSRVASTVAPVPAGHVAASSSEEVGIRALREPNQVGLGERLKRAVQEGMEAGRRNFVPGLGITVLAALVVAAYYFSGPARAAMESLSRFRDQAGWLFPIVSTAIFGGLVPLLVRRMLLRSPLQASVLTFGVVFWGYKGFEVALLYRVQAWLWGEGNDFATIAAKVFIDQAVYCPLIAVPLMVLAYLWQSAGFSRQGLRQALQEKPYWERALPVWISNTAVWLPAVSAIYLLPTPLQLPLQNLVLVGWVLLLVFLTERPGGSPERRHRCGD